MILTPGAKKRMIDKLNHLLTLIDEEQDREVIMWYAAEIMPLCVSELCYYEKPKSISRNTKNRKSKTPKVSDPNRCGTMKGHDW